MDISGDFDIPASRQQVWEALNDPDVLAQCIPGCESIERQSDTELQAKMKAKFGPVKARFESRIQLSNLNPPQSYVGVMALLAMAVGALNLLQLIPILPLDGGQVLRATMQSFGAVWARRILLAAAALGVLGSAWIGDYIIAAVAVLGGVGAWHMDTEPSDVRPMGVLATSVIGVGYAVTLAVHAGATIFGLWALGIFFYLI